jgi:hypothetical protein
MTYRSKLNIAKLAIASLAVISFQPDAFGDDLIWEGAPGKVIWQKAITPATIDTIFLERTGGQKEMVFQIASDFAFGQAHWDGDKIALLCGHSVLGNFMYWRFDRRGSRWEPVSRADLGTITAFPDTISNLRLVGVDKITGISDEEQKPVVQIPIEITSIPLKPEIKGSIEKLVLINGEIYKPYGGGRRLGDIRDQPLEKILKDHEARKGTPSAESSKPSESKHTPAEPQPTSPVGSAKPSAPLQPSTKSESSVFTLMIIGGVIVLGIAGLVYRLKRGRR